MGLFIPTSGPARVPIQAHAITKGQIYAKDLTPNEFINFQFNPENFEWEKKFHFAEYFAHGDATGGDVQYLSTGPLTMDLPLLFVAEPGAPHLEYSVAAPFAPRETQFGADFDFVYSTIERWMEKQPIMARPSRVAIFMGKFRVVGIIRRIQSQIIERFENGDVREGLITLEFREWTQKGI